MKKNAFLILVMFFFLAPISCKKKKKNAIKKTTFTVDTHFTKIQWTAYKTTDKIPVKGIFKEFSVENLQPSEKINAQILDNAKFKIPVSSLFSDDATGTRDPKIKNLFFGIMKNTTLLSGTFHITDSISGYADFTMNAVTKKLPFTYKIAHKKMKVTALMHFKEWDTQAAFESIHKACELLHTGPDGISKTWDEVKIDLDIVFKKQ